MYPAKHTMTTVNGREISVEASRIACNDVRLPFESHAWGNTNNMALWIIGNEYGVCGAVWADNEQDALDTLVDEDLGAGLLVDAETAKEGEAEFPDDPYLGCGNASEPCDLDNAWMERVKLDPVKDFELICRMAEARGASCCTLDGV